MSKFQVGLTFELKQSFYFHQQGIPLLVSPLVLRNRNTGQIDLAYISGQVINIIECKKNGLVSGQQLQRLRLSAGLLSLWLNMPSKLKVCKDSFAKEGDAF